MTKFEDLDDDCLCEVLDKLSPKHLFKMQRINRRLNRLATSKLQVKIQMILMNKESGSFRECHHLSSKSYKILALDRLMETKLEMFNETSTSFTDKSKEDVLRVLSNLPAIKSIDFTSGVFDLTGDYLLELFRRCPQLECIKLYRFDMDKLGQCFDLIGHRIVHFAQLSYFEEESELTRMILKISIKCPNIKQFDLYKETPTSELMLALKTLPTTCRVAFKCDDFTGNNFEDVFDVLFSWNKLNWSAFPRRVHRLSSLKFDYLKYKDISRPIRGVDFLSLKKLKLDSTRRSFDVLVVSQFPVLEEFSFSGNYLNEDDYNALFQRMPSVKKLTIEYSGFQEPFDVIKKLPQTALYQLKNIETIDLKFFYIAPCIHWEIENIPKLLELYVVEINSLKKLVVDFKPITMFRWLREVKEAVKQLNVKQNRVKVEMFYEN